MEITSLEDLREALRPALREGSHWIFVADEGLGDEAIERVIDALIAEGRDPQELHFGSVKVVSITTRARTVVLVVAVPKCELSEERIRELLPVGDDWTGHDKSLIHLNTQEVELINSLFQSIYDDTPLYVNGRENLN